VEVNTGSVLYLRALAGHGGAELHPLLRTLPQPGPRLASDLLFLISALPGGGTTAWPGSAVVEMLERAGRSDLVRGLGTDLAQASRNADTSAGDWRLMTLPFYHGAELQQLRLYLRRNRRGPADDRREKATRFVLEVELTRLGALQLDGLVQPRRFDLMLRSRRSLPEEWRQDIAQIFAEANEAVGNDGEIVFQASADWRPMEPGNATTTAPGGLLV